MRKNKKIHVFVVVFSFIIVFGFSLNVLSQKNDQSSLQDSAVDNVEVNKKNNTTDNTIQEKKDIEAEKTIKPDNKTIENTQNENNIANVSDKKSTKDNPVDYKSVNKEESVEANNTDLKSTDKKSKVETSKQDISKTSEAKKDVIEEGTNKPIAKKEVKDTQKLLKDGDVKKSQLDSTEPVIAIDNNESLNENKTEQSNSINIKNFKVKPEYLLSIEDGVFRYKSIEGLNLEDKNLKKYVENSNVINENLKDNEFDDSKGIFGLSKKKSDTIAKILLFLIILLVIILYKIRTQNSSNKVLRRFPK